jgi:hypothetical protein
MFTGVYRVSAGKSECRDFRIAGFTCMSAFSINSVGVSFMDFAGKLSYMDVVDNYMHIL